MRGKIEKRERDRKSGREIKKIGYREKERCRERDRDKRKEEKILVLKQQIISDP